VIPVQAKPEPPEFDDRVRTPGKEFLATCPRPTTKQYSSRNYWRKVLPQLYESYDGICVFSCQWISPPPTGFGTVEHFKPKKKYPQFAYEWDNYRLVCGALNGCKGEHEDVLDPFTIQDGWFVIRFPSLLVTPNDNLAARTSRQVQATIDRLKLNNELTCVSGRLQWLAEYCKLATDITEEIAFNYLRRRAPFIAVELDRQRLRGTICEMLRM